MGGTARYSRGQRIQRRSDYLRIQERGLRASTSHFVVLVAPSSSVASAAASDDDVAAAAPSRLGIVASRKVGCAVERNRAKRLVREAFRRNRQLFGDGMDWVIIVRSGAQELSLAEVEGQISQACNTLRRRAARAAPRADSSS